MLWEAIAAIESYYLIIVRLGFGVADIAETHFLLFGVSHDGECNSNMEFGGITRS